MARERNPRRDNRYNSRSRAARSQERQTGAHVQGVDDFSQLLQSLGSAAFGRSLRSAVTFAANPILKQARKNAVFDGHEKDDEGHFTYTGKFVRKGFTRKSVKKKVFKSRDGEMAVAKIGVEPEAYYAVQFVELGTSKQPAQPWLRPALNQQVSQATRVFGERMSNAIDREINARPTRRISRNDTYLNPNMRRNFRL